MFLIYFNNVNNVYKVQSMMAPLYTLREDSVFALFSGTTLKMITYNDGDMVRPQQRRNVL